MHSIATCHPRREDATPSLSLGPRCRAWVGNAKPSLGLLLDQQAGQRIQSRCSVHVATDQTDVLQESSAYGRREDRACANKRECVSV